MDGIANTGSHRQTAKGKKADRANRVQRRDRIQMDGPTLNGLPRFFTISLAEKINLFKSLKAPLSGYLGGIDKAGYFVTKLQSDWCERFGVPYAVACNSATSGLLAACMAIGVKPGDTVWTSAYTMSATAACAKVLGANIVLIDIESIRYSMNMNMFSQARPLPKCVIVTNLFGHPAYLSAMRSWCDSNKVWMIEDNAQSPFATENGKYAGTIGHLGVFSLNVHKHIQAGEGGVVVSHDHDLILRTQGAINHGELGTDCYEGAQERVGLNLRMTEPVAAIACAQLAKADAIISDRIELAEALTSFFKPIPWVETPSADVDCRHVYYLWAARVREGKRQSFVRAMRHCGMPINEGYSIPLYHVFPGHDESAYPITRHMENKELISFEVCMWNPRLSHLRIMRDIVNKAAGEAYGNEDSEP